MLIKGQLAERIEQRHQQQEAVLAVRFCCCCQCTPNQAVMLPPRPLQRGSS